LYFSLIDPIIKTNKNLTDQEIEQEIKKKFKMQGLILADVKVVKMMDQDIEGSSDIIPAYLDKNGNLSNAKSSSITKKQFEHLQKYLKELLKQIGQEILSGDISLTPYYNTKTAKTPCEYCSYKTVCGFQKGFCKNDYQYIKNQTKEEILEKIGGDHGSIQ